MHDVNSLVDALAHIADVYVIGDTDEARIWHFAPPSDGADTGPGSAWYDECDVRLEAVRAALPAGWTADWSDDDVVIMRDESEE